MRTTALFFSPSGAQRLIVLGYADEDGTANPDGAYASVTDRPKVTKSVLMERRLLMAFREEQL